MATIRLIPSAYSLSNTSYLSISNASNMYTDTDSTTYATVTHGRNRTTSYYIYVKGFNFDDIPADAIINSATVKVRAKVTSASSYTPVLYNNTTSLGVNFDGTIGTSDTTRTVDITSNWDTYKGYGSNFGIRLQLNRSNSGTASSMNIYGAEILVDYTIPTSYTISTSIAGGTLRSPTTASMTVSGGADCEITFNGETDYTFLSMTVNGVEVTPITKTAPAILPTYTVSTNYSTYSTYSLSNAYDGDDSSYFWSAEAQTSGKYILITFSDFVNLSSFSTYSSNSTDYPHPCNVLQVSADRTSWTDIGTFSNSQTSTFSNITNANNIKYVRIYATSGVSNWLVLNEITMSYEAVGAGEEYYSYTISAVDNDKTVVITFVEPPAHYVKIDGDWKKVLTIYKKIDGAWTEFEYAHTDNEKLVYMGNVVSDVIGEVTSDYALNITDTSIPNDTYYFYYENENKQKLTDWGVIGSTEFNGYNGGEITTGEEVGTIASDNTITLTNPSLASGDYTMYYEDADGTKLEGWDSIGTITK